MNLRFKAPLLVALASGGIFLCTGYACSRAQLDYIESMRKQKLTAVAVSLKSGLDGSARGASSQADFLANLGSVKTALRSGDRDTLYAAIHPVYMLMNVKGGAEQGLFLDRDMKVFLDVRDPSRMGEDMSGRETVVRANRYKETQSGIEVSTTGLSMRAVASIDSGSEHLGSFEWGVSLGRFLQRVKDTTGTKLSVFVDERAITKDVAHAGSGSRSAAEGDAGGGLKSVVSSSPEDGDLVKSVLSNEFLNSVTEDTLSSRALLGVEYDIVAVPLFDFAGRQIGVIGGVKPMSESRSEVRTMVTTFLVGTGIGVVVLAVVVFLVFEMLLRRPLFGLEHSIEAFAKGGELDKPVAHQGRPDEFGGTSKSLNKLREKLLADQKLAAEAEIIVTTRRLKKADRDLTIDEPPRDPSKEPPKAP